MLKFDAVALADEYKITTKWRICKPKRTMPDGLVPLSFLNEILTLFVLFIKKIVILYD